MKRSSTRNASDRVALTAARATLDAADDTHLMQEVQLRLFHGEQADTIEHFHPYGFTAVPKKPSKDSSGVMRKAEAVVLFQNGSRSHPLAIVIGDRRYRLKNGQEGEVAVHDDQGQVVHLTRSGIVVDGGPSKLPVIVQCGNAVTVTKDGKICAQVGGAKGPAAVVKADAAYIGGDPDQGGTFDFVLTASGPSTTAKAKIG